MDLILTGMKFNKTVLHCKMSMIAIVTITPAFSFLPNFSLLKDWILVPFSSHPFNPYLSALFISAVILISYPALSYSKP